MQIATDNHTVLLWLRQLGAGAVGVAAAGAARGVAAATAGALGLEGHTCKIVLIVSVH